MFVLLTFIRQDLMYLICCFVCCWIRLSQLARSSNCSNVVPSEQLRLIRKAEEPVMKSRMTLTSKCQLVLHYLLFTLTLPLIGVHDHAEGSWQI